MPLGGGARAVLPVRCHTRDVGIVVVPLCLRHRWASVNRGRFTYVRPNRGPLQRMSDSSATFSSRWGISISGKIVSSDCPSVGVCHEKSVSKLWSIVYSRQRSTVYGSKIKFELATRSDVQKFHMNCSTDFEQNIMCILFKTMVRWTEECSGFQGRAVKVKVTAGSYIWMRFWSSGGGSSCSDACVSKYSISSDISYSSRDHQ